VELNERISFKIIVLRKPKVASKLGRKEIKLLEWLMRLNNTLLKKR